ncbi:MAG: tRNA (adenosine(37)-N6)-threonylcarbamoyltransferase complex ATPase subunit type 1 TsaE [Methylococcaceae bacterium]|nr:tRNA (adenosine(37)-N6)-threonylcarbamoyltransferase complex ATPase subunit type 1 TsaE [Methylococcaceae bacterium]
MKITLINEQETEQIGAELWRILPKKCLVFLKGDLGAGKTTLTRGLLRAAGYKKTVKSPTYTLVEEYEMSDRKVFHFDLYRIKDPQELEWIGIHDYLEQQSICFVEWPELGKGWLPVPDIELSITTEGKGRIVEIQILSEKLLKKLILRWKNKDIVL